jgi:hypothetical protein
LPLDTQQRAGLAAERVPERRLNMHHVLEDSQTELRGALAEITDASEPFPYEEGFYLFNNLAVLIAAGHVADPVAACQVLLAELNEDILTVVANIDGKVLDCRPLVDFDATDPMNLIMLRYMHGRAFVPVDENGEPLIEGLDDEPDACCDEPECSATALSAGFNPCSDPNCCPTNETNQFAELSMFQEHLINQAVELCGRPSWKRADHIALLEGLAFSLPNYPETKAVAHPSMTGIADTLKTLPGLIQHLGLTHGLTSLG